MFSTETLEISGYQNQPVPNRFIRLDEGTEHVAILLPGMGYTCDKPLLYYTTRLLLELKADVLQVNYNYRQNPTYQNSSDSEQAQWLLADSAAACQVALGQRPYKRITLIGKSIGTMAMSHLLKADEALVDAEAIWLTPVLLHDPTFDGMRQCRQRSLCVIGNADRFYDESRLRELDQLPDMDVIIIDGAEHSMDIGLDVPASLAAMDKVMRAIEQFLG